MKLNTKSRYAVMALADLAQFPLNKPISLRDISLRQSISLLYLEQIFLKLKKNNIVKSIRGSSGGYILNKEPEHIKLSNIFLLDKQQSVPSQFPLQWRLSSVIFAFVCGHLP